MTRISREAWAMGLALLTAQRSTCLRRNVGCVLLNEMGHVLATGYNGVARGQPHCNATHERSFASAPRLPRRVNDRLEAADEAYVAVHAVHSPNACPSASAPSGQSLDGCQAIHAEQNALLQCKDVEKIHSCFTTSSPCMACVKLLMNTSCQNIFYVDEYPHPEARDLWLSDSDRSWAKVSMPE